MIRLGLLAGLVAAVVASAACKPESARRADRAAKEVVEQRNELIKAASEGPTQVLAEAGELTRAAREFEHTKAARVAALRGQYGVIASQSPLIGTLAREFPITDAARGDINEKLTRFKARLDEAANVIEGLSRSTIDAWEQRDADATDVMERLDEARKDAWTALADAPHIDHTAS